MTNPTAIITEALAKLTQGAVPAKGQLQGQGVQVYNPQGVQVYTPQVWTPPAQAPAQNQNQNHTCQPSTISGQVRKAGNLRPYLTDVQSHSIPVLTTENIFAKFIATDTGGKDTKWSKEANRKFFLGDGSQESYITKKFLYAVSAKFDVSAKIVTGEIDLEMGGALKSFFASRMALSGFTDGNSESLFLAGVPFCELLGDGNPMLFDADQVSGVDQDSWHLQVDYDGTGRLSDVELTNIALKDASATINIRIAINGYFANTREEAMAYIARAEYSPVRRAFMR